MSIRTPAQHEALIQALMDPDRWVAGGGERRRIDTHISSVVLAGDDAYKIKKPLNLGFLDFLDLESRHRACLEELRLNRRHAPDLYLSVCAVTGSIDAPQLNGEGPAIDWAVHMRRFDPDAILSNRVADLSPGLIDTLADRVAAFHRAAAVCADDEPFGTPQAACTPMRDNFDQIRALNGDLDSALLDRLHDWTDAGCTHLAEIIGRRRDEGHVRECHGDLHLGNVALIDGQPVLFDAIEFNPGLRWIDTMNDIAFLTMDMHRSGRDELAYRFLDRYLQGGGDYGGLAVLRLYEVYRALVRAKIASIRNRQELSVDEHNAVAAELMVYLELAGQLTRERRGALVIAHGVSGSGKSYQSARLPGPLPAVRLRSDVERKRLLGIAPERDATDAGGYTADLTHQTYERLAELARQVVEAGYIAVVDATFLQRAQRDHFRALATRLGVPFVVLDCDAPPDTLRERILARQGAADNVSDADLAVLERQLQARDPLDDRERADSLPVRPGSPSPVEALRERLGR